MKCVNFNNFVLIIITLICPPAGALLALVFLHRNDRNWKICIFCVAYTLSVFAYCYEPTVDSDLVRYREIIQQVKTMSFVDAINYDLYGEGNLYVFMGICWVLGKIGQPNLLQALSVFFVFFIAGYVNYSVAITNNVSNRESFEAFVFILLNASFYTLTNNVRNIFAFCIIVYAVYRDVCINKKDIFTIILYIAPCFMHASAVLLVMFRLIVFMTGKIKWLLLALVVIMKPLVEYFSTIFLHIESSNIVVQLIRTLLYKGNRYYNNYSSAWAIAAHNSGSMRLMKIIIVIECTIITLFLFKNTRCVKKNNDLQTSKLNQIEKRKKIINYLFLIDIMGFACAPMHMPEYWRFMVIIVLFNGVILFSYECGQVRSNIWHMISRSLFVLSPIYFILCIRDLFLYSKPISMIMNSFFCHPVVMIIVGENGLDGVYF